MFGIKILKIDFVIAIKLYLTFYPPTQGDEAKKV